MPGGPAGGNPAGEGGMGGFERWAPAPAPPWHSAAVPLPRGRAIMMPGVNAPQAALAIKRAFTRNWDFYGRQCAASRDRKALLHPGALNGRRC